MTKVFPRLSIKSVGDKPLPQYTRIYLDDVDISNYVTGISFDSKVGSANIATITLRTVIEIESVPVVIRRLLESEKLEDVEEEEKE